MELLRIVTIGQAEVAFNLIAEGGGRPLPVVHVVCDGTSKSANKNKRNSNSNGI